MTSAPPDPHQPLALLQQALEQLRQLASQPAADPVYARSAEQFMAVVSAFQPHIPVASGLIPNSG